MDFQKLESVLKENNQPAYRYKQIAEFYFQKNPEIWEEFSNLPKDLRTICEKEIPLKTVMKEKMEISSDGTKKALLKLSDSELIETVHIPLKEGVDTACVSCQVGCPMSCTFCATGQMGLKRNLTFSEIVDQIAFWNNFLKKENKKITRVVYMGMGEPMLNFDEVIKSIKFLNQKNTLGMAYRRFTISSSGIVDKLNDLMKEDLPGLQLAISLHAPSDELRSRLMPVNRKYPLKDLMQFCEKFAKEKEQTIFFEYVMLEGINNSEKEAKELAVLLKKIPFAQANLINYHSTGSKYKNSSMEKTLKFQEILKKNGIQTFIRKSAGEDIKAACGQLKIGAS